MVMLSVTHLLHHMGRVFQEQIPTLTVPDGMQIDRKLLSKIKEKGHKVDDHEEYSEPSMTM